MKYFIIAGEKSGDLHGSNLITELHRYDAAADIKCWGGELMKLAGATILKNYRDTAFMGFTEVLKNIQKIRHNLSLCKAQITEFNPDAVILIDYPGFNLRVAAFAHENGFRVFYYIAPKICAWNEKRVKKIRDYVDRVYIIFPFEVDFYKKHNIKVEYRGNPVMDEIEKVSSALPEKDILKRSLGLDDRPVIGILAGSRKNEVGKVLPRVLEILPHFPDYQFIIAGVEDIPDDLYYQIIKTNPVKLIKNKTYEILMVSEAAIVTSGTATLEAALLKIPQVVCFRGDFISMLIAWMVIRVRYISLVNLIMDSGVVKELIQYSLNKSNLSGELKAILPGGNKRSVIISAYEDLRKKLGDSGVSSRIAKDMVMTIKKGIPAK